MCLIYAALTFLACCGRFDFALDNKGDSFVEKIEELSLQLNRGQDAGSNAVHSYIKRELEENGRQPYECLEILSSPLDSDGSATLHLLVDKDNAEAFRFVMDYAVKNFPSEASKLLHQTDRMGRSVIALVFSGAPLCLMQLAEITEQVQNVEVINFGKLREQINERLFDEETGEAFNFNVLSSLLVIPSLYAFDYLTDRTEVCLKGVEFLRGLMGEREFYECFMSKSRDLFELLCTLLSLRDVRVDGTGISKYFFSRFGDRVTNRDLYEAAVEFKENLLNRVVVNRNWDMLDFLLEQLADLLQENDHLHIRVMLGSTIREFGLMELKDIVGNPDFPHLNGYFHEQELWEAMGIKAPKTSAATGELELLTSDKMPAAASAEGSGEAEVYMAEKIQEMKDMIKSLAENMKLIGDIEAMDALAKLEEKVLAHEVPHASRSTERVLLPLNTSLPTRGRGVQETTI